MGEGEAALSGGLERLGGDGAAVRVGRVGPGRLCAGLQAMRNLTARSAWAAAEKIARLSPFRTLINREQTIM